MKSVIHWPPQSPLSHSHATPHGTMLSTPAQPEERGGPCMPAPLSTQLPCCGKGRDKQGSKEYKHTAFPDSLSTPDRETAQRRENMCKTKKCGLAEALSSLQPVAVGCPTVCMCHKTLLLMSAAGMGAGESSASRMSRMPDDEHSCTAPHYGAAWTAPPSTNTGSEVSSFSSAPGSPMPTSGPSSVKLCRNKEQKDRNCENMAAIPGALAVRRGMVLALTPTVPLPAHELCGIAYVATTEWGVPGCWMYLWALQEEYPPTPGAPRPGGSLTLCRTPQFPQPVSALSLPLCWGNGNHDIVIPFTSKQQKLAEMRISSKTVVGKFGDGHVLTPFLNPL
ncbi:hypothetical protein DV515_00001394 [Chloebia gouldiae]|uniref:Uncharacterized protein n=1 Tax=Chloebia gouldiae TaxID=44316 RepID=A0A3L8T2B9_CHLGU|nr:hypothetical protein DV515_00001394 [Chloebia gouldiae]